jgi:hypothetical protein
MILSTKAKADGTTLRVARQTLGRGDIAAP